MNEIMTRAELEILYPDEWILMVDPEPANDTDYRGRVVAHGKDKAELLRKAKDLPIPRHVAIFFTGPPIPPGMKLLGLTPRGYVSPDQIKQAESGRRD